METETFNNYSSNVKLLYAEVSKKKQLVTCLLSNSDTSSLWGPVDPVITPFSNDSEFFRWIF